MTRCVCGRVYRNPLRDWITILVLVLGLSLVIRTERERRVYVRASAELRGLADEAKQMLDSIGAYPR